MVGGLRWGLPLIDLSGLKTCRSMTSSNPP
jgi:hypothetical protein